MLIISKHFPYFPLYYTDMWILVLSFKLDEFLKFDN